MIVKAENIILHAAKLVLNKTFNDQQHNKLVHIKNLQELQQLTRIQLYDNKSKFKKKSKKCFRKKSKKYKLKRLHNKLVVKYIQEKKIGILQENIKRINLFERKF